MLGREFASAGEFLNFFRDAGYFLDDLCLEPVNNFGKPARRQARKAGVSTLANRIRKHSPLAVICIMKAIEPQIRIAVAQSGVHLEWGFHCIPFPAMSHQLEYQSSLESVLNMLSHF